MFPSFRECCYRQGLQRGRRHNRQCNCSVLLCPFVMALMGTTSVCVCVCLMFLLLQPAGLVQGQTCCVRHSPSGSVAVLALKGQVSPTISFPSLGTHKKRNIHLPDIKSEQPVPIQTRTLETHLVTQICISPSLYNNTLLCFSFLLSVLLFFFTLPTYSCLPFWPNTLQQCCTPTHLHSAPHLHNEFASH